MPRIKCQQCGKRFSGTRERCPRCEMSLKEKHPLHWLKIGIMLIVLAGLCGALSAIHFQKGKSVGLISHALRQIPTLDELLVLSPEELAKRDIAMINLVCAEGLYGAENLNINECLRQIDEWSEQAGKLLAEREFMFFQAPEQSGHSINRWRCSALGQYLSQIIGLSYHPDRKGLKSGGAYDTHHFQDSRDFMIHGLILEKNRGTCASMPVLYTAIARRLGYPVELVTTRNHLFSRWVDPEGKETFNIEWTDTYVDFKSNEFYKVFPGKLNPGEIERQGYLTSLSKEQAMSSFMHLRGMCLWFHDDLEGARKAFIEASRLDNNRLIRQGYIREVEKQIESGRIKQ